MVIAGCAGKVYSSQNLYIDGKLIYFWWLFLFRKIWQILTVQPLQSTWGIMQKKWSCTSGNFKEKPLNTLRHNYMWRLIIDKSLSRINYKYGNKYIFYCNFPRRCQALFLWWSYLLGNMTLKLKYEPSLGIWISVKTLIWPLAIRREDFCWGWLWLC